MARAIRVLSEFSTLHHYSISLKLFGAKAATITTIVADNTVSGFKATTSRVDSHSQQDKLQQSKNPFNTLSQSAKEKTDDNYEILDDPSETMNKVSNTVSALGEEDSLPGEVVNLKTFCTMFPNQFPKISSDGVFAITNYKASDCY